MYSSFSFTLNSLQYNYVEHRSDLRKWWSHLRDRVPGKRLQAAGVSQQYKPHVCMRKTTFFTNLMRWIIEPDNTGHPSPNVFFLCPRMHFAMFQGPMAAGHRARHRSLPSKCHTHWLVVRCPKLVKTQCTRARSSVVARKGSLWQGRQVLSRYASFILRWTPSSISEVHLQMAPAAMHFSVAVWFNMI